MKPNLTARETAQGTSVLSTPHNVRLPGPRGRARFAIRYFIRGVVGTGRTAAVRRLLAVPVAQCVSNIIYQHNQAKETGCYSEKMTRYTKVSNT